MWEQIEKYILIIVSYIHQFLEITILNYIFLDVPKNKLSDESTACSDLIRNSTPCRQTKKKIHPH